MTGLKSFFRKFHSKSNISNKTHSFRSSIDENSKTGISISIDDHLQKVADNHHRTLRILLLGPGGSGKSTILKQMDRKYNKKVNKNSSLPEFKQSVLVMIHRNIVHDIIDLCKYYLILKSQDTDLIFKDPQLQEIVLYIAVEFIANTDYVLSVDIATYIQKLWASEVFRKVFDVRKRSHIMDNLPYFFDNIMQYASVEYCPTFDDYVRVRNPTIGIRSSSFAVRGNFKEWIFNVIDVGGQRAERRKWMKVFDNINFVLYVMSLAAYDQVLYEDKSQMCWDESFSLFEKTVNNKAFVSTDFIVFLNKCDIFADKIKNVSFMAYIDGGEKKKQLLPHTPMNNNCMESASYADISNYVHKKMPIKQKKKKKYHMVAHSTSMSDTDLSDGGLLDDRIPVFKESDGNSPTVVISWAEKRFLKIFYGGQIKYSKQSARRQIYFHVTCATDLQQIGAVIDIVKIEMIKMNLKGNLFL